MILSELKKHLEIKDSLYMLEKESRGIASKKPIKKDEIIISIPDKFLLTFQKIPYSLKIENIHQINSIFAYFLYEESKKGKDSDWYFYIKTFPSKESIYKNFPLFLDDKIIEIIKDTFFGKKLIKLKKNIEKDISILEKYFKKTIDSKEFTYFISLVLSRLFSYRNKLLMVPYIDLINHSKEENTKWYYKKGYFQLKSIENIDPGEEIVDSYGDLSNIELYLHYGFTLPRKKKSKKFSFLKNEHLKNILR